MAGKRKMKMKIITQYFYYYAIIFMIIANNKI